LYNGTYIIPTSIACWIIIPAILKRFLPPKGNKK
jgi:hypothetical protein